MATLEQVKTDLRISHNKLDEDIQATMQAALLDLSSGGASTSTDDELQDIAVKLYCRWHYDFAGQADRYHDAYESLKNVLSLTRPEVTGNEV